MKVIISPAKKMKITYDEKKEITTPVFFEKAKKLAKIDKRVFSNGDRKHNES